MAILQIPGVPTSSTKKKLELKSPEEIERIVSCAIDEVNRGSITVIDELIRKRS